MGARVELKSIDAGVYFSSDAGNPDTASHFYADFEMFTNGPTVPYPVLDYMTSFKSDDPANDLAQQANEWSGTNYGRWVSQEYNDFWTQALVELDPDRQAELFHGMNDAVVNDVAVIPLVFRKAVVAHSNRLVASTASATRRGHRMSATSRTGLRRIVPEPSLECRPQAAAPPKRILHPHTP